MEQKLITTTNNNILPMNKILSKEVSFELAKLLKEKNIEVNPFERKYLYHLDKDGNEITDKQTIERFKGVIPNNDMNVAKSILSFSFIKAPTIAEVIDWVYEKDGIWISVSCDCGNDNLFYSKIFSTEIGIDRCIETIKNKDTPLEAYEEAIKYVLLN